VEEDDTDQEKKKMKEYEILGRSWGITQSGTDSIHPDGFTNTAKQLIFFFSLFLFFQSKTILERKGRKPFLNSFGRSWED
jgi:hypothetical protein